MKIVAQYSTPTEAHVAKTRLESAGIDAEIRDEFTVTFNWLWSDAVGGVKIAVADEDYLAAREIIKAPAGEESLFPCPHCGSHHTRVRVLGVFGVICLLLKLPIPMTRVIVDCHSCRKFFDVPINGKTPR